MAKEKKSKDESPFLNRELPGMLADVGGLDGFFVARLRAPST